jgi:hypothetical protein
MDHGELLRYLRELAAFTGLPAVWCGSDRRHLGESLADLLVRLLCPDLVYVQIKAPMAADTLEVVRAARVLDVGARAGEISKALAPWLPCDTLTTAALALPRPLGDGLLNAIMTPLGAGGAFGVVMAASGQCNFPTEEDRLVLSIAANQAAVVLQRWRAEEALRASRAGLRDGGVIAETNGRVAVAQATGAVQ